MTIIEKEKMMKKGNRKNGRCFAVASPSGGVGKTTISIALSACLAEQGSRVLLLDTDFLRPTLYYMSEFLRGLKTDPIVNLTQRYVNASPDNGLEGPFSPKKTSKPPCFEDEVKSWAKSALVQEKILSGVHLTGPFPPEDIEIMGGSLIHWCMTGVFDHFMSSALHVLKKLFDFIIIDTGTGFRGTSYAVMENNEVDGIITLFTSNSLPGSVDIIERLNLGKPYIYVLNKATREVGKTAFTLPTDQIRAVKWCPEWIHIESFHDIMEGLSDTRENIESLANAITST